MVLTKVWLQEEIDSEPNPAIKLALERVFLKYTEAPVEGKSSDNQTILKDFDATELFSKIVHHYVDKEGYTVESAEVVAKSTVNREKKRRGLPIA